MKEWLQAQISKLAGLAGEDAWIIYIFLIVFATLLIDFISKGVLRRIERRLKATATIWDDALIHSVRAPFSVLVWVLGISFVGNVMEFSAINRIREVGIIIVIGWAIVRFIRQVEERVVAAGELKEDKIDRTTAGAISQLLRVAVIITAFLVTLQTLGFNISAILAFGGIGGIAVGFAAKDLLANFFGGLMIYMDRPFAIGDWVRSPDREIEGTVERIGWRLTVIRTFDKRPLYIPNAVFNTIAIENPSRMLHRRIKETIGIRYDDISVMPDIVRDVKAMLRAHPDIEQEQIMIVNFDAFSASSVDFLVYTFTKTTVWTEFHEVKQDVLLKISEIVAQHGAEIAYPTSTLHVPEPILLEHEAQASTSG